MGPGVCKGGAVISRSWMIWSCSGAGVNAASVAEATLMTLLMLARRAKEQMAVFQQKGLGEPFGIQLAGKRLGIVGMGNIGNQGQALSASVARTQGYSNGRQGCAQSFLIIRRACRHACACSLHA